MSGGVVNVRGRGAKADAATDDTTIIQAALDAAAAQGAAVYIPAGTYRVDGTLTVSSRFAIFGDGAGRSVLYALRQNRPLLQINVNGGNITGCSIRDVGLAAGWQDGDAESSSAAVRITGDGSLLQWSEFANLWIRGFRDGFLIDGASHATAFGDEGPVNWCRFHDISIHENTRWPLTAFRFRTGSGTGNTFAGITANMRSGGAVIECDGSGKVVGDIIVTGGHWGADGGAGCTGLRIGADTVYRQRITLHGVQFDAGCNTPLDLSSAGSAPYRHVRLVDCNPGGSAAIGAGVPTIEDSDIDDIDAGEWRAGSRKTSAATGAQSVDLFRLTLSPHTALVADLDVCGFVQGVGVGVATARIHAYADADTVTVAQSGDVQTPNGRLVPSAATSGLTATLRASLTPSLTGSTLSAQVRARGDRFRLERL